MNTEITLTDMSKAMDLKLCMPVLELYLYMNSIKEAVYKEKYIESMAILKRLFWRIYQMAFWKVYTSSSFSVSVYFIWDYRMRVDISYKYILSQKLTISSTNPKNIKTMIKLIYKTS